MAFIRGKYKRNYTIHLRDMTGHGRGPSAERRAHEPETKAELRGAATALILSLILMTCGKRGSRCHHRGEP